MIRNLVSVSSFVFLFVGANPYLTFHCSSQGTVLIDLAPDDKEFQSVEEEVCKHTFTHTHPDTTYV